MRKRIVFLFCVISTFLFLGCPKESADVEVEQEKNSIICFEDSVAVKDTGSKVFGTRTAKEAVSDMRIGWNMGNTFDSTGNATANSEISWGQPKVTKEMIDGLKNSQIKTIRLPVSWALHMSSKNYTVDPDYMKRIKQVVDWCIEDGFYVIINSHHDCWSSSSQMPACKGYYPNNINFEESERYLVNLWTQIGLAFNNGYDDHLIFETMNEPRLMGTSYEWWYDNNAVVCREAADCLNKLNQVVVDAIRATGGNNQKRFISVPALQASPDSALNPAFVMPHDDEPGKLILSVHMYTPYSFAMEHPGETEYTQEHKNTIESYFSRLNNNFVKYGYPVIVGEMGATNKDNLDDRVRWFTDFITIAKQYGIVCCLWDNGDWEIMYGNYSEHYGYYNRYTYDWYFPEIHKAIIEASK